MSFFLGGSVVRLVLSVSLAQNVLARLSYVEKHWIIFTVELLFSTAPGNITLPSEAEMGTRPHGKNSAWTSSRNCDFGQVFLDTYKIMLRFTVFL